MACGEARPESDIDLLIATDPEAGFGFFELFEVKRELEELLGRSVQFAFRSEMRPSLQESIGEGRIGIS